MSKPLSFDDEAVEELESAAQWYEEQKDGLGIEFVHAVRKALLRIAERPHTWPARPRVPAQLNARQFVLRRLWRIGGSNPRPSACKTSRVRRFGHFGIRSNRCDSTFI